MEKYFGKISKSIFWVSAVVGLIIYFVDDDHHSVLASQTVTCTNLDSFILYLLPCF